MINIERKTNHEDGSTKLEVFRFGVIVKENKINCRLTGIDVFKKSKSQRNMRLFLRLESYRTSDTIKIQEYVKDKSILLDAEEALQKMIHVSF